MNILQIIIQREITDQTNLDLITTNLDLIRNTQNVQPGPGRE